MAGLALKLANVKRESKGEKKKKISKKALDKKSPKNKILKTKKKGKSKTKKVKKNSAPTGKLPQVA